MPVDVLAVSFSSGISVCARFVEQGGVKTYGIK